MRTPRERGKEIARKIAEALPDIVAAGTWAPRNNPMYVYITVRERAWRPLCTFAGPLDLVTAWVERGMQGGVEGFLDGPYEVEIYGMHPRKRRAP